jgi:hypothetical protein
MFRHSHRLRFDFSFSLITLFDTAAVHYAATAISLDFFTDSPPFRHYAMIAIAAITPLITPFRHYAAIITPPFSPFSLMPLLPRHAATIRFSIIADWRCFRLRHYADATPLLPISPMRYIFMRQISAIHFQLHALFSPSPAMPPPPAIISRHATLMPCRHFQLSPLFRRHRHLSPYAIRCFFATLILISTAPRHG